MKPNRIEIVKHSESNTEITIGAYFDQKKSTMLFYWIIAWFVGGLLLISQYFFTIDNKTKIGIIIWGVFWLYFLQFTYRTYRWRKHGTEKLSIKDGVINYYRHVFKPFKEETVNVASIREIELLEINERNFFQSISLAYWAIGGERILLRTSIGDIRLGMELDDAEAKQLIKLLKGEMKGKN